MLIAIGVFLIANLLHRATIRTWVFWSATALSELTRTTRLRADRLRPMPAPGEQPPSRLVRPRVVLGVLLVCGLSLALLSRVGFLDEYRLYLTENRKPASLDFASLSEDWTETSVHERFGGFPVFCNGYEGDLPVQRVCTVDVESVNGIPALFMTFMFARGHLDQMIVNIPWWSRQSARDWLDQRFGSPSASEFLPLGGPRLIGWRRDDGTAVFFNRDLSYLPPFWNSIYWRSASACKDHGCFRN